MVGPARARAAGADRGFPRLERRRSGRDPRGGLSRARLECGEVRGHRSGGLRRLPGEQAARLARRGTDAKDRLARERLLPRSHPRDGARRGAAARRRAEPALEDVLEARARPRARARASSSSSRSARCSQTCRTRAPHRSPARRAIPSSSPSLGLQHSRYEGPTGIVGVLQDACRSEGVPAASLWAAVPHYVSLAPSPRAARALCDRLAQLLAVPIDTAELAAGGGGLRRTGHGGGLHRRVARPRRTSPSSSAARTSSTSRSTRDPVWRHLAAELTRFLRERDAENGDDRPRDQ